MQAEDLEFSKQVVAQILGRDVTRGDLAKAFARVEPRDNWKNPIDAEVVLSSDFEMMTISEAVTFYTGSVPTFVPVAVITKCGKTTGQTKYRVRAAGYFATIGA